MAERLYENGGLPFRSCGGGTEAVSHEPGIPVRISCWSRGGRAEAMAQKPGAPRPKFRVIFLEWSMLRQPTRGYGAERRASGSLTDTKSTQEAGIDLIFVSVNDPLRDRADGRSPRRAAHFGLVSACAMDHRSVSVAVTFGGVAAVCRAGAVRGAGAALRQRRAAQFAPLPQFAAFP